MIYDWLITAGCFVAVGALLVAWFSERVNNQLTQDTIDIADATIKRMKGR